MQVDREQLLATRFKVTLTDAEVAQFVMDGVIRKLGIADRAKAKAWIHDHDLLHVEVEATVPIDTLLAVGIAEI